MENKDNIVELLVDKIGTLPGFPRAVKKICAVTADPEASANDVVSVLKMDPVIVVRVLKLVNSAYIGIGGNVSSLQNAVVILGQKRIYSLVIASSIVSVFKNDKLPFDNERFWKHSVTVAIVCESIASYLRRYEPVDLEEIFCAGILHDIGKLMLGVYGPEYITTSCKQMCKNKTPFYLNEKEDISHSGIGALVAKYWNFPDELIEPVLYHHRPESAGNYRKFTEIVHLADIIAHGIGFNTIENEPSPELNEKALDDVGLALEVLKIIAEKAIKKEKNIEALINFIS